MAGELVRELGHPFRLIVFGASGSGKSSALRFLALDGAGTWDRVIVNAESATVNHSFDYASNRLDGDASAKILAIIGYQKRRLQQGQRLLRVLLILEDFSATYSGASKNIAKIVLTARHWSISVVVVAHRLTSLPPPVRDQATAIIVTSKVRADQTARLRELTELEGYDLTRALSGIRTGRPLLLKVGSDAAFYVPVPARFATRALDAAEPAPIDEEEPDEDYPEPDDYE